MATTPPSTADLIQLKQITDGVLILKDGSIRAVVEVSAINFELRSTEEQAAILQQFQGFLNSLDFPMQMLIQSRKFDITTYLTTVQTAAEQLTNELLKVQAQEYMRFVSELSDLANVMSKKFFVALPFSVVPSGQKKGLLESVKEVFAKKPAGPEVIPAEQLAAYKAQLQQRADLVIGGLSGLGLKGKLLDQDELIALFTALYNPVVPAAKKS